MSATSRSAVEEHWTVGTVADLGATILAALQRLGKNIDALTPADLAAVDEFHVGGRGATEELAVRAGIRPEWKVLDVGSGLGGSARHLAHEYGCHVTGVDLTKTYCDTANMLSQRMGLSERTSFHHGSALELPFADASFDLVWTEHAQMNVADKPRFYGEIARVLKPEGRLAFHDLLQGPGGGIYFPVPWAASPSLSHLVTPDALESLLGSLGFRASCWNDATEQGLVGFQRILEQVRKSGAPVLGTHFLQGADARQKAENQIRNLAEKRITVIQAVLIRG